MLLVFYNLSGSRLKNFSYLGQELLSFFVELCAVLEFTLVRIEVLNDFFDTAQSVMDF